MSLAYVKHLVKRSLGRPDPAWEFRRFLRAVPQHTRDAHDAVLDWAAAMASQAGAIETEAAYAASGDPVVREGWELRKGVLDAFRNIRADKERHRVLVHVPDAVVSPGGYSLFTNLVQSLGFVGVPARALGWDEAIGGVLERFRPTVLLTSDNRPYLERIDWDAVAAYRATRELALGLTASSETDGNEPFPARIEWARRHGVRFYFGFGCPEYYAQEPGFAPLREAGFAVLPLEFGANILEYYPVPGVERDLDYVFLGSVNRSKWPRYARYLGGVVPGYHGFFDGPGWEWADRCLLRDAPQAAQRYVYARARAGLNLHLDVQVGRTADLNERTYMLAACGVPQVVDAPGLLTRRFSPQGLFIARDENEYAMLLRRVVEDAGHARERALIAMREVYDRHTTCHRAVAFMQGMETVLREGGAR